MMFNELLIQFAQKHPAKAAVITNERSITYGELDTAVDSFARHLRGRGLQTGDRIAVHWHNSVEFAELLLGGWRAGLVIVPVNTRLKTAEIAYVVEHSGARLCFSEPALAGLVNGVEVMSELPAVTQGCGSPPDADPDAPAVIIYTSGTTSRPKGVVHSQRTLLEGARIHANLVPGSDDRPLAIMQMAHIAALQLFFLQGLMQGATVVLLRSFDAAAALDMIERYGCTYVGALPAMLHLLVEEQAERPRDVSSLRGMLAGGDCVSTTLQCRVRDHFRMEVQEICGMTEVLPTTVNPRGAVRPGSIGKPANASIRIVDASGNDVEPGCVGEMAVQSAANCLGYWNDPEATAQLFKGGWLHTGDLASRDEDGYLWFKGRLKQIIIRGGSNISPQEVEEAFYRHPAVLEAGVVGLPDPTFGEIPVAFVALREGRRSPKKELLAHVRTLVADYKTPERIYFMDELPKGLTGKIDRRRLREILLADPDLIESKIEARV